MQRAGALAITGGYRTSPTDTLNAHVSVLPMHLKIRKIFFRSVMRLASLSNSHPLHRQYWLAARKVRRHQSALHYMTQIYGIKSDEVETLPVVRQNPAKRHRLPMNVEIPKDKETSV
jgi:formate dehydrogenase maturation protein FdhE